MFNFRKITAMGASALMVGMTMGVAAAANFPTPFSGQPASGVAVVTGTGSGVDDSVAAGDISAYLSTRVTGGTSTLVGTGDSYKFEKTSTKYHLGDKITDVVTGNLDNDELPTLLASGIFVDDDNDRFDYDQKITMGALQLTMFDDDDFRVDDPTVGFRIGSGTTILTYTLDFTDEPLFSDLPTADLTFMGKTYYVLSNSSNGINKILTLLDSAEDTLLSEGETATVSGKQVSISFINGNEVKLDVDGEVTNTLEEGETQQLLSGDYVGIKDILFNSKDTGISKVDFSIGSGKLKLTSGSDLEVNEDTVSGLAVTITNSSDGNKLSSIKIAWSDDNEDLFVTTDSSIIMTTFEAVKMSFGGINYPTEETLEVKQGGELYAVLENFPLKDSVEDIPFLYGASAGTFSGIGKDSDDETKTAFATGNTNLTWNKSAGDNYFVVAWSDGNDGESYLIRASQFDNTNNQVDFEYRKGGAWTSLKSNREELDVFDVGNAGAQIKLEELGTGANNQYVIVSNATTSTDFHTLYSVEGMKVFLPYSVSVDSSDEGAITFPDGNTTGHNNASFYLVFREEDKDDNVASGDWINLTIGWDGSSTKEVEVSAVDTSNTDASSTEIDDTDVFRDFTYSALATEILFNKPSSGQKSVKLVYHGGEVSADVYLSAPSVSVSGVEAGSLVFKDNEKATWSGRHVVLVGGSCINSATAEVLGVSVGTCSADFTSATNVGAGEYMIKSVGNAFTSGKIALVVAGYDKADTQAAASKLVNSPQDVDTTSGKEYRGKTGVTGSLAFSEVQ